VYGMGHVSYPMCYVTSLIDLELVNIEENHLSSTRDRLLGSY